MEYYDIVSLIVFLKKQSHNQFKGIIELVEVLDSKEIANSEKGDLFIKILRRHGLKELEFPEYDRKINITPVDKPDESLWRKYSEGKYQLDLYICILLDGKKRFIQNLN